jgi:hypothetical protein
VHMRVHPTSSRRLISVSFKSNEPTIDRTDVT